MLGPRREAPSPRRLSSTAGKRFARWQEDIAGWRKEWDAFTRPNFDLSGSPLRPERVVKEVRRALPDDAIISLDSGVHHNWFMQFWEARRPRRC